MTFDFQKMLAAMPVVSDEEIARHEAERREREERDRRHQARLLLSDAPVPRPVLDAIIDGTLEATAALSVMRKWLEARRTKGSKPTLVLLGGAGCGKTTAAVYAMAQDPHRATYAKIRDVANLYRAGFGEDSARFEAMLRDGLLVVDELTTERDVDLGRAALHEVIDERQAKGRSTVLIANRTKAEFRERYDARTIDRLREGAVVVELAGKSMRKGAW